MLMTYTIKIEEYFTISKIIKIFLKMIKTEMARHQGGTKCGIQKKKELDINI